ncbi:MAG: hypothetical protein JWN78_2014 [Bacteroidota bacterium]|nr:hypothetical protein [Bacteroidota bacterium]
MLGDFIDKNLDIYLEKNYSEYIENWLKVRDGIIDQEDTSKIYWQTIQSIAYSYFELGDKIMASIYYKMLIDHYTSNKMTENKDYFQSLAFYYVCNKHQNIFFKHRILSILSKFDNLYQIEKNKLEAQLTMYYMKGIIFFTFILCGITAIKILLQEVYNWKWGIVYSIAISALLIYCLISIFFSTINKKLIGFLLNSITDRVSL